MKFAKTREIVIHGLAKLGFPKHLFDLHSLRAGDTLKTLRRRRQRSTLKSSRQIEDMQLNRAKDGYIKDN